MFTEGKVFVNCALLKSRCQQKWKEEETILFYLLNSWSLGLTQFKAYPGLFSAWQGAEEWHGLGAGGFPHWWALRNLPPKEKPASQGYGPQMALRPPH